MASRKSCYSWQTQTKPGQGLGTRLKAVVQSETGFSLLFFSLKKRRKEEAVLLLKHEANSTISLSGSSETNHFGAFFLKQRCCFDVLKFSCFVVLVFSCPCVVAFWCSKQKKKVVSLCLLNKKFH